MSASIATIHATSYDTAAPRRALGAVAVLGAPVFLVEWLAAPRGGSLPNDRVAALLGLWYLAGWTCSAVALHRTRATGRVGAAILAVQLVGLALAASQQIQDLTQRRSLGDTIYGICDAAWPLSHVFMLVVGVAVLRARVWTGWRRWTPLACGLALPLSFAAAAALGRPAMLTAFPFLTTLTFGALGLAIAVA